MDINLTVSNIIKKRLLISKKFKYRERHSMYESKRFVSINFCIVWCLLGSLRIS